MKIKQALIALSTVWVIWTWIYKYNEIVRDLVVEVMGKMNSENNKKQNWFVNNETDENNETYEDIVKLKLEKWNFYLLEIDQTKTLISLKNFKSNKYLDWGIAPTMEIYSEYEEWKYFKILGTFVLPKWKWNSWDVYSDWYRCITNLPFGYKLNSYDREEWTMGLDLISRLEWDLKITEQNDLSKFDLKKRPRIINEENDKEIIAIYKKIDNKLNN